MPVFNTHIRSEEVTKSEKVLGYFIGPCLACMVYSGLPSYVMTSYLAEVLGHVVDGFSASVNSMTQTVALGLRQTVLLAGISSLGYIAPESTSQIIAQPDSIITFFHACFTVLPVIGNVTCAFLISFYRLGDKPAV